MYSKGSKIRMTVDCPEGGFKVGDVFTLTGDGTRAHFKDNDNFYRSREKGFELVSPVWVPKVGDRVLVLDNITPSGLPIKQYEVGKEYAVTGVCKDGNGGDAVLLVGHHQYLRQDQFAKPAALTIEPGKFYKTRDGRKVGPMKVYDRYGYIVKLGYGAAWNADGTYRKFSEVQSDLIAEWQEPAVVQSAQVDALAEEYGPAKVAASNDNAPKFKVGDRVKFRADYGSSAYAGKEAVVLGVNQWGNDGIRVHTGIGQCSISTERAASLELVPPTTPAIVALIENGSPLPATKPKVHADQTAATKEAERLALAYPGQEFGVFVLADRKIADVVKTAVLRAA